MVCEICFDRGVFINDKNEPVKCLCVVKKEIKAMLGELVSYELDKSIELEKLQTCLNIIDGAEKDFYSLIKSFLFKTYFEESINKSSYKRASGYNIVEYYLNSDMNYLIEVPYLFINLTEYCNNKSLGETVLYVMRQRNIFNRITWTYCGKMKSDEIASVYNPELLEYIMQVKTISLNRR